MSDPFSALKNALQSIFLLASERNGKYFYPEVQQLKQALENFQPNNKRSFIALLKALRAAVPYIEKWRIDFNTVRDPIDALAKKLNLPIIDWDKYLLHSSASPKFQFSALHRTHQEVELLPWLNAKSGASVGRHNFNTQVNILLEYREHFGFSQKLSTHLKKDPDFLVRLIMESDKNFSLIAHTRIVLYLTDIQLAEAIIKHIPSFVQNNPNPVEQATKLVEKLNEILSNGRSVSTLLRNAEAKFILDSSKFMQIYQNGVNEIRQPSASTYPLSSQEERGSKPSFKA